ncbi:hypothetical protein EI94DRAFT_1706662 [Lactarius quietus]|nr:hypothetical protein EI94DRAFT_1706662 [Lactarius quietus]
MTCILPYPVPRQPEERGSTRAGSPNRAVRHRAVIADLPTPGLVQPNIKTAGNAGLRSVRAGFRETAQCVKDKDKDHRLSTRYESGRSSRNAIAMKCPRVHLTTLMTKGKNPNPGLVNASVCDEAWNYDRKGVALALLSRRSQFHSPQCLARLGNCPWTPRQAGIAARKLTRWRRVLIVIDGVVGPQDGWEKPEWGIAEPVYASAPPLVSAYLDMHFCCRFENEEGASSEDANACLRSSTEDKRKCFRSCLLPIRTNEKKRESIVSRRRGISYWTTGPHVVSNRYKYAPKEAEIPEQTRVGINFVRVEQRGSFRMTLGPEKGSLP